MDDFVRKMHTKSGLLPEIEASTSASRPRRRQVLAYVTAPRPARPATAPLCGNSIGVDRRFLDRYMRDLDEYLHYRSIDVSSLKELCRRWYPAIYRKRPGQGRDTPRARRHPRVDRGAALLSRATVPPQLDGLRIGTTCAARAGTGHREARRAPSSG